MFLLLKGDLEGRFDAQYYAENLDLTGFEKLRKFINVKGGKRLPKGSYYSSEVTDYQYLRVDSINDFGGVDESSFKFISEEIFSILQNYQLQNNDLIISIAGTIGKVALIDNLKNETILTENCAKLQIKKGIQLLPQYLYLLLNTSNAKRQISQSYIQTTIPKLGLERIYNLKIPHIPSPEIQKEIITFFEQAYDTKKANEAQAKALLASIDSYLLEELGITLPEQQENSLNNRVFIRNINEVSGGRFDAFYFKTDNSIIKGGTFLNHKLKSIAKISKGQSITKENVVEGKYPVIAGGQSSPYSHNEYNHLGNIITISASGAYSGFVWYHDYPIFASDCCVIQSKSESDLKTIFLTEILKLKQKEIYDLQQGSGQPHVYASDLAELQIPLPPFEIQEKIVSEITKRRKQAQSLQAQAKAVLEQAKTEVERMILGL